MNISRFIPVVLLGILPLTIVSCGKDDDDNSNEPQVVDSKKKLASISNGTTNSVFTYNSQGKVKELTQTATTTSKITYSYSGSTITMDNGGTISTISLDSDGRLINSITDSQGYSSNTSWSYQNGNCNTYNRKSSLDAGTLLTYTINKDLTWSDGDLMEITTYSETPSGKSTYTNKYEYANKIDNVAGLSFSIENGDIENPQFSKGLSSKHLPTSITEGSNTKKLEWTLDGDGYPTSLKYGSVTYKFKWE